MSCTLTSPHTQDETVFITVKEKVAGVMTFYHGNISSKGWKEKSKCCVRTDETFVRGCVIQVREECDSLFTFYVDSWQHFCTQRYLLILMK
jgi:hypothetical protein